ncbi:MAG: chemotaxis-specific protein-glutamate methyltransferase CheB, partial [Thermodesulfobacteriota bacterium]
MEITVGMGEIEVKKSPHLLMAVGIGSCIAVVLYDGDTRIGGLSHIVLPYIEEAHDNSHPARFADVAIDMMIGEMKRQGVCIQNIKAKIFGGANMFPEIIPSKSTMDVGKRNILAVREELKKHNIEIVIEEVGGQIGCTVLFDTSDGSVLVKTANLGERKYQLEMNMADKIRILVVDDSAFMRKLLVEMIESDPEYKVIKTARDGLEALKAVEEFRPDVVTMDVELPEIDGLTCVVYIMKEFPTPVVMVTGFSMFLGEETIQALEYGAVGLVRKPKGPISQSIGKIKQELISQIKLASQVDARKLTPVTIKETKEKVEKLTLKTTNKIVAMASSSGGPRALSQIIPELPADLPAGVLVVQHMPADFIPPLAKRLNRESILEVKVAEDLETIQQGKVLIAPTSFHCRIESTGEKGEAIRLASPASEENFHFTLADEPMISLAPIYGKNATGVVLTGMGHDGTEGLRAIKKYGGHTIA